MTHRKRKQFTKRSLHTHKQPHPAMQYLSQRVTFWIAVLSVMAFVTGNMMGQHGWRVFWMSVLGEQNDSLIVYSGTVPPVASVPDYRNWHAAAGISSLQFSDIPASALVPLLQYNSNRQKSGEDQYVYSIGYMGAYDTGAEGEGSHPGTDIRMPVGTPVQSVMNGIVTRVGEDRGGFGKFIVIRHPNVPDPDQPAKITVLHSVYAHLNEMSVVEGEIVGKGQQIGKSGQTGLASGPHLHFQIDRDTFRDGTKVPYHPYWPFTSAEARAANYSFSQAIDNGLFQDRGYSATVNPMLYVQAQYAPVLVAQSKASDPQLTPEERREQRIAGRLARRQTEEKEVAVKASLVATAGTEERAASSSSAQASSVTSVAPQAAASSSAAPSVLSAPYSAEVAGVDIQHPRTFTGRKWETITVILRDAQGDVAASGRLDHDLYLRTAFGRAEFRPPILTPLDFRNGKATVQVLPLGHQTLVIEIKPEGVLGGPMRYVGE
ncbi:MAG: M23 family metallopeptidase [Candidatus Peribacteraceae bacterium]|jgi:murein DD-endopeptidase MepM/ murein hydrolase activator NlpD